VENPSVARNAFQRVYDMILSYGSDHVHAVQAGDTIAIKFFADPIDHGADAIFGLERAADAAGGFLQIRRAGIWHRKAHSASARPGRFIQIDHGPAAEKGAGILLARPTPASASPIPGGCRIKAGGDEASSTSNARCTKSRCC
jgi:hypothetical protein